MSRLYDWYRDYDGPGPQDSDADEQPPEEDEFIPCMMCVPLEFRMDEDEAKAAGHEWPARKVITSFVGDRADPTVVYKLECGHIVI